MPEKMSDTKSKLKRPRLSSEASFSSSSSSSLSSSSDEETNAKDLKPIKEYLGDRKELASQLFKSVKAEKIRMMLPQVLRKMDLNDLEELCASELIGMSKKRITCIINDKEMLESSETDESDDSGPSLEIISDTEWISDNETNIKVEGAKSKGKKNDKKSKKKTQVEKNQDSKDKSKVKSKGKVKVETDGKSNTKVKAEKIKTEGKPKEKEKEGESILDLLELEMRARAIRALIRKEEGTSNKKPAAQTNSESGTSSDQSNKTRQANLKEQLEKIQIDNVLLRHGDDEDVFVVIKPAPTIELLSSDSDNDDHSKRVNKKLVSERTSESENVQDKEQTDKNKSESTSTNKEENESNDVASTSKENELEVSSKKNKNQKESSNLPMSVTESIADDKQEQPNLPEDLEDGEIVDDGEDEVNNKEAKDSTADTELKKKIKKVKKNPNIRSRQKSKDSDAESDLASKIAAELKNEKSKENKSKTKIDAVESIEIEDSPKRDNDSKTIGNSKSGTDKITSIDLDDDKALDIEEIINLDDYPDDMDIIEKNDSNEDETENEKKDSATQESDKATTSSSRSETWASRYVKQDDVQNVIKESKIQSEIRKRLREKQRQSKMNNSPKPKNEEVSQPTPEVVIPKPTGSVKEYLALKGVPVEKNTNTFEDSSNSTNSLQTKEQTQLQLGESTVISKESLSKCSVTTAGVTKAPENIIVGGAEPTKIENKEANESQQNILRCLKKEALDEQKTTTNTIEKVKEKNDEKNQAKDYLNSSAKSDSSDDSVIVKIDSEISSSKTVQILNRKNVEQTD